jgi:hypothetical protein
MFPVRSDSTARMGISLPESLELKEFFAMIRHGYGRGYLPKGAIGGKVMPKAGVCFVLLPETPELTE